MDPLRYQPTPVPPRPDVGLILRDSPHKDAATQGGALELAGEGPSADPCGQRRESFELARRAEWLQTRGLGGGF